MISNTIRHPISGLLAAGLVLVAGVLPAAAQQRVGAVVCVGSELETLASSNPVRRLNPHGHGTYLPGGRRCVRTRPG